MPRKMIQAPSGKMVPAPEGYDEPKAVKPYDTNTQHDGGFSVAPNPANAGRTVFGVGQGDQDRGRKR